MITKTANLFTSTSFSGKKTVLLAALLAGGALMVSAKPADGGQSPTTAQSAPPAQAAPQAQSSTPQAQPASSPWRGRQLNGLSRRAETYYEGMWGVTELRVKTAESGEMIRFNYRVVDPEKAAILNSKKSEPELLDPQAGVKLQVPQM